MKYRITLNERIRDLREERGLKQNEFGDINISASTMSEYEKDGKNIPSNVIVTLAEFFGVSTDYLLGLTNIRNPKNNSLKDIHFSDEALTILRQKDVNTRLLSEMIEHPGFRQFLTDAESFVDGYVDEVIEQVFSLYQFSGKALPDLSPNSINDSYKNVLKRADEIKKTFHAHILSNDLFPILNDLKADHMKDNETAGLNSAPAQLQKLLQDLPAPGTGSQVPVINEETKELLMKELVSVMAQSTSAMTGSKDPKPMEKMITDMLYSDEFKQIRQHSELFESDPRKRRQMDETDSSITSNNDANKKDDKTQK